MNNVYPVTSTRRKGAERGRGFPSPYDTCTRILNTLTSKVAILMYVAIFCVLGTTFAQLNQRTINTKLTGRALRTSSTNVGQVGGPGVVNTQTGVLCFQQTFNYTDDGSLLPGYGGTIFKWVVPNGVTSVTIEVKGASGSSSTNAPGSLLPPGLGADQKATFNVSGCQTLWILPGGQPNAGFADGGGGSFVTTGVGVVTSTALIVAGGGGGAGNVANPQANGQLSTAPNNAGGNAPQDGFGGINGSGGHAATNPNSVSGSGGGGFLGNGDAGTGTFANTHPGFGFPAYASNTNNNNSGGFGGGGSGGTSTGTTGGGGGGYSGGAGGDMNNGVGGVGGGGGSFISGTATSIITNNNTTLANSGNGVVIITYCYPCPTSVSTNNNIGGNNSNATRSTCQTTAGLFTLTAVPVTDFANSGNAGTCNAAAGNNPAFEYAFQWFRDGVAIAGQTSRTLTVSSATAGTHTYTVSVDCGGGTGPVSNPGTTVTVNSTPTASFAGGVGGTSSKTVCTGGTVTYTINVCNATPGGQSTVRVQAQPSASIQSVVINGSTGTFTPAPSPTQNTTYTILDVTDNTTGCVGTASNTCAGGSTTATATVNNGPQLSNVNTPAPQCAGQTIVLSTSSSNPAVTYQWYKNSVPICTTPGCPAGDGATFTGANTATLTITNAQQGETGLYYVTATDPVALAAGTGCATGTSNVVTVTINPLPTGTFTPASPTVNTVCNGSVACQTINFTGTPPFTLVYTRTFDPGGGVTTSVTNTVSTTGGATSLCLPIPTNNAGTYQFSINSIQDANCVNTVNNPSQATDVVTTPFSISATPTGINCASGTGTVTVTPSGGINTITYTLSGPTSRPSQQACFNCPVTFTNLTAGVYTVTAVNGNTAACVATTTFTIANAPSPVVINSAGTTSAVACNGGTTSVVVRASGGTGSLTYSLDGGPQSPLQPNGATYTITGSNVGAGTHTITATDANGCTSSVFNLVVIPPSPVVASGTPGVSSLSCKGGTTVINATATGGANNTTYRYVLTGGPGGPQTSGPTANQPGTYQFQNVFAGTYQVTATDVNGCTGTSTTITITEPATALAGTATRTNAVCNSGASGTVVATAYGGTAGATPTSTSGSLYTFTLAGPSTGTLTTSTNPVNGGITTATFSNLLPGTYTVTVRDANNCVTILNSVVVGAPNAITGTVTNTTIGCNGQTSSVTIGNIAGGNGTLPITYTITGTNSSGQPYTASFQNNSTSDFAWPDPLTAGSYSVTASQSGCPSQPIGSNLPTLGALVIGQPNPIVVTRSFTPLTCSSSTSTVTLSASGGTGTRTFRLINASTSVEVPGSPVVNNGGGGAGVTTATFSNVPAGTYNWIVTDNSGCQAVSTTNPNTQVIITPPSNVTITNSTTVNNTCFNGQTGSFTVNSSGGTGTLTYVLQTPSGSTYAGSNTMTSANPGSATFSNLPAGNYTVTVTDAAGCGGTVTTTIITQPAGVLPPGTSNGAPDLLLTDVNSAQSFTTGASCVSITYSISIKNTGGANVAASGVVVRVTRPFSGYTVTLAPGQSAMWTQTFTATSLLSFYEYTLNPGFQVSCSGLPTTLQVIVCRNGDVNTSNGSPITGSVRNGNNPAVQDVNDYDNARAHLYGIQ